MAFTRPRAKTTVAISVWAASQATPAPSIPRRGTSTKVKPRTSPLSAKRRAITVVMWRATRARLTASATTALGSADSASRRSVLVPSAAYQDPKSRRPSGAKTTISATTGTSSRSVCCSACR